MEDRSEVDVLTDRFEALWQRCARPDVLMDALPICRDVIDRYAEPQRRYHTVEHLTHCLVEHDRASSQMSRPDPVEMALWFHDAIFEPGAADNERHSADIFVAYGEHSLPTSFVEEVRALILLTTHRHKPDTEEGCFVVDIDLSSFGIPWDEFLRDSRRVRDERTDLGDEDYYRAQTGFLRSLLDRPRIFHTAFFHSLYEDTARANIARAMQRIASHGRL
jgi:predicted metal-dependent HD superfamily phosphohydrolase